MTQSEIQRLNAHVERVAMVLARQIAGGSMDRLHSLGLSEFDLLRRFTVRELPDGSPIAQIERTLSLAPTKAGDRWTVTVSDDTEDRYGDVIDPKGWDLKNYSRNPVWLVDHDYRVQAIVGRGENPRVEGGRLVFDFLAAPVNANAATDMVLALLDAGMLRAVSVGFMPRKWQKVSNDKGEWTGGFHYLEQELLENSWVAVPANPNATLGADPDARLSLPSPGTPGHEHEPQDTDTGLAAAAHAANRLSLAALALSLTAGER